MNLFISYDYNDAEKVAGFMGMLANPDIKGIQHRDTSVKHDYTAGGDAAIARAIRAELARADVTVCMVTKKTRKSEWVNWELEQSRTLGLGVLAIALKDIQVAAGDYHEFFTRYPKYHTYAWGTPEEMNKWINLARQYRAE